MRIGPPGIRRARFALSLGLALPLSAAALVVPVTETIAFAQGTPSEQDIAQARQLGQQAQASYEAGKYAESEKQWAAARNLYPVAPTLSLGLARTQAKLGKFVAAQENYNRIIREAAATPPTAQAFKDAVEAAKAEVVAVSGKIASVVLSVDGPQNLTVTVDGQSVPTAALGFKRPIDPGSHVVKAEAPGYRSAEATFQVAEGGSAEAKLRLEKSAEAAATPAPVVAPPTSTTPTTEPPAADKKSSSNKTLAIVAFGVGGVGLAVGAVTGLLAMGKAGDLDEKCGADGKACPGDVQSDIDSYKTMGTISTIGFIAGGVGIAAGAVLWFTAPKETASAGSGHYATVKPSFQPYVGLGSAGVTGRF